MKLSRDNEFNKDTTLVEVSGSNNVGKIERFLKWKGYGHACYNAYSTIERWNNNLSIHKGLFLSNGINWNDIQDREQLLKDSDDYVKFAMCFSSMKSENVAMWMLYGGKGKNGGMISLNNALLHRIIKECESVSYGMFEGSAFIGKEIDLSCCVPFLIDILYCGENEDGTMTINRGNEETKLQNNGQWLNDFKYKKTFPWKYECECRLVIGVKKSELPEDISSRSYFLKIGLSDEIIEEIRKNMYYAPNYIGEKNEYKVSNLRGYIDWNICKGCLLINKHKSQIER